MLAIAPRGEKRGALRQTAESKRKNLRAILPLLPSPSCNGWSILLIIAPGTFHRVGEMRAATWGIGVREQM